MGAMFSLTMGTIYLDKENSNTPIPNIYFAKQT